MATHVKSYDIVGKKESVHDAISMLDKTDTPFLSSIREIPISNTFYQWLEDALRAATKNAREEGAEANYSDRTQPAMRQNGTQIVGEDFQVSGTSEAVKQYGRSGTVAYETAKTGKVIKQDLEHSLIGTGQTYVPHSAGTPGEFAGVQAQIHGDVTVDGGGDALAEQDIIDTHEKIYNEGSDASTLMIKPSDAKVVADFATDQARTRELGAGKKITRSVNVYEGPFGTVMVKLNRHMRPTEALMYKPENWKLAVLRKWEREKLAKTGDSEKWAVRGEFGLRHTNQKATGLITNLA